MIIPRRLTKNHYKKINYNFKQQILIYYKNVCHKSDTIKKLEKLNQYKKQKTKNNELNHSEDIC